MFDIYSSYVRYEFETTLVFTLQFLFNTFCCIIIYKIILYYRTFFYDLILLMLVSLVAQSAYRPRQVNLLIN